MCELLGFLVTGFNTFEICVLEVVLKTFCSIKYNLFRQLMAS